MWTLFSKTNARKSTKKDFIKQVDTSSTRGHTKIATQHPHPFLALLHSRNSNFTHYLLIAQMTTNLFPLNISPIYILHPSLDLVSISLSPPATTLPIPPATNFCTPPLPLLTPSSTATSQYVLLLPLHLVSLLRRWGTFGEVWLVLGYAIYLGFVPQYRTPVLR